MIRRHVAPKVAVPLHPEAAAFAAHYGFTIDVLAAYRPTGKGRVERQVSIVRDHVIAGRHFDTVAEIDAAFATWLPIRRAKVHRTHGQVIAVRAEVDPAALAPLPAQPYLVADRHLRRVGKDALISFEGSLYSVPARAVRPGQRVVVAVHRDTTSTGDTVVVHATATDGGAWLATHPRAALKGSWIVDPEHWAGLPDGHTRATTTEQPVAEPAGADLVAAQPEPLAALLHRHGANLPVTTRPLIDYHHAATNPTHPQGVAS